MIRFLFRFIGFCLSATAFALFMYDGTTTARAEQPNCDGCTFKVTPATCDTCRITQDVTGFKKLRENTGDGSEDVPASDIHRFKAKQNVWLFVVGDHGDADNVCVGDKPRGSCFWVNRDAVSFPDDIRVTSESSAFNKHTKRTIRCLQATAESCEQ